MMAVTSGRLYDGTLATFYAAAARFRIRMYFNLGGDPDDWRRWLAANGPLVARAAVDETWSESGDRDGDLDTYRPETVRGGHAVCVVGYSGDRFIVRNSWGTVCGDKGFGLASEAYARSALTDVYGIVV